MHKLLIYLGTSRTGNYSQHVAQLVLEVAQRHHTFEAELVTADLVGIDFSNEGESASPDWFKEKVAAADAFILVTPEYNHGYPATLKYLLDLNLKEYIHKPVSFVGVSSGGFGGTRVIEALTSVVRELGLVASFEDVNVSHVKKIVADDGTFQDQEKWEERIEKMLDELAWLSKTLQYGRENVS